ncbi:MAG: hypothetical protein WBF67_08955 [Olleya sp.]
MKSLAIFLIFRFVVLSNFAFGQSNDIVGTYNLEWKGSNGNLKRELVLNTDGTFQFHNSEYHEGGIPKEKNSYAKGTWEIDKLVVSFSTISSDFDEKFTLDFNKTKARFITKSPRDKSNRDIKTALRFYQCEIFWIRGMKLEKVVN